MAQSRALAALKVYLAASRIRLGHLVAAWFLVSLFLPAVRYGHDFGLPGSWWNWGWQDFILGPFGILVLQPAWYANIIIFAAIHFFLTDRVLHWGWGLLSVLLAASALIEYGHQSCLGGGCSMAVEFGAGYWLWLALTAFLTIVCFVDRFQMETSASPIKE